MKELLSTKLVLKPEEIIGPKDAQKMTTFIKKKRKNKKKLPYYILMSHTFSRSTVDGMVQRPFSAQTWGFSETIWFCIMNMHKALPSRTGLTTGPQILRILQYFIAHTSALNRQAP